MKKILIISFCTGGMMKDQFVEYCSEFANKEYEIHCLTNDDVDNKKINATSILNLRFKRKEPWTYFSISKIRRAKKYIRDVTPDLVFLFTPHPVNIFIFKTIRKYLVLTQIHDPVPHSGNSLLDKIVLKIQLKICYKYSNFFSVAGDSLKNEIIKKFSVAPNRIFTIPLALLPSRKLPLAKINSNKTIDILFYGRIEYYKGLDVLMNALELTERSLNVVIAGKGNVYFKIPKCKSNIKIINDYVSNENILTMIQNAKLVVLPYRDASGTMIVSEVFYCGTPIVATDVGVLKEYVGDCGIVVPPNNPHSLISAILQMLDDDELRKNMANKTIYLIDNYFDICRVCNTYSSLFLDLINGEIHEKM